MAEGLTTTSYAILGLLAVKPWTTYELAQQMKRAVGQFWPRAESNLYAEPKKLVALGLATASKEMVGNRPRTVYTITAEGRRALAEWIPTPGAGPVLEFEQLIKIFFAEHGSKQDLLATIEAAHGPGPRSRVGEHRGHPGYLQGEGPFPERLPWIMLSGQFLKEYHVRCRPLGGMGDRGRRGVARRHHQPPSPTGPSSKPWPPTPTSTSAGRPSAGGRRPRRSEA